LNHAFSGLFLDLGLGKTVTTLTAIDILLNELLEVDKVLVIAPLRVAEDTWATEIDKWDHLHHLTLSKVLGSERQRKEALRVKADIYVINRENVPWLIGYYGTSFPFDMVVIDELSSFKNAKAIRFKTLRQVRPYIKRVVGLTGTPAPNGLIDLWPQIYLLDRGERLGKTITEYRDRFFTPGNRNGQVIFNYKPRDGSDRVIYNRLSDICISMKSEDYLKLPDRIDRRVDLTLSERDRQRYETFEREAVLSLMSGYITAVNAAALSTKLLQFANGAVYDMDRVVQEIHKVKISALDDILDTANGQPVLVFYHYKHDAERIHKYLKKYSPRELKTTADIQDWNAGGVLLMLAHPKSAGHGLNLQAGGNIIVWFGLTWSLEEFQQANARLYRQGQKHAVIVHYLTIKGTMDEDVMLALEGKAESQEALMQAVKARIVKYKP
jgi:SNF2 family DNA or RNA helicase